MVLEHLDHSPCLVPLGGVATGLILDQDCVAALEGG